VLLIELSRVFSENRTSSLSFTLLSGINIKEDSLALLQVVNRVQCLLPLIHLELLTDLTSEVLSARIDVILNYLEEVLSSLLLQFLPHIRVEVEPAYLLVMQVEFLGVELQVLASDVPQENHVRVGGHAREQTAAPLAPTAVQEEQGVQTLYSVQVGLPEGVIIFVAEHIFQVIFLLYPLSLVLPLT
jgi:hypothetical protein